MRSFVVLLLCSLVVGNMAFFLVREARDADDDSEEHLPSKFRSSAILQLEAREDFTSLSKATPYTIPTTPQQVLETIAKIASVAALILITTGTITAGNNTRSTGIANIENVLGDVSEFVNQLPGNFPFGLRRESIANESVLALQELNTFIDEGAITAVAQMRGESRGELSFLQALQDTGSNITIIAGTLRGLKPGLHKLQVTLKGDITGDCSNTGEAYSAGSDGVFVANDQGKALVVVRVTNAPLKGSDTILGRSVVIASEEEPEKRTTCGVIVHPV